MSNPKTHLTAGALLDALKDLPRDTEIYIDDADTGWFLKAYEGVTWEPVPEDAPKNAFFIHGVYGD